MAMFNTDDEIHYCSDIDGPCQLVHDYDARISRLKAAGDELAESVEVMRAQADVWVGPRVVTALQAWKEEVEDGHS